MFAVWLILLLAQTYWKLHESKMAESAAEKAHRLAPGDPMVLKALSLFYSESGDFEKAAECVAGYASKRPAGGIRPRDACCYPIESLRGVLLFRAGARC